MGSYAETFIRLDLSSVSELWVLASSTMLFMKLGFLFISLGIAQGSKPTLGVYYESLCPYSRQFITEEVWPAYNALAEYFDVFFIAYGNAKTTGDLESGFSIKCQHGERECEGNVVQACTVKYQPDMWTQVYLLNCMSDAGKPETAGPVCFEELGLDYAPVEACAAGQEGQELHFKNGEIHHSLKPGAYGVPWPTWDGVGGDDVINEMDSLGLIGYLCKYFYNMDLPDGICQSGKEGRMRLTLNH